MMVINISYKNFLGKKLMVKMERGARGVDWALSLSWG